LSKQHISELDSIRAIAAISVVIYHYSYRYFDIYGGGHSFDFLSYLKHGVELFFIVSGFVIYMTLEKVKSPLDFIVSRFSRLYPVYWVCVCLTFLVISIFGLPGREVSFTNALMNLLMFHEYFKIPHVDGVYWTLTVELTFYFWIFIFYIFSVLEKFRLIMMALVITAFVSSYMGHPFNKFFFRALQLDFMPFFIAGITFYNIWRDKSIKSINAGYLSALVILFMLQYNMVEFIIYVFLLGIFGLLVSDRLKWLAIPPLMKIGVVSYSLYLIHQNVGYIIINMLLYKIGHVMAALVAGTIALTIALILQKYIEKPSLSAIRSAYERNHTLSKMRHKWRPFFN
jgi:peptidoglycan/LPS O-acetylase OafA/YrhL